MGHVWIEAEISDRNKVKNQKVKALVDTGATLTVIPEYLANKLGIREEREEKISTGAGEIKIKRGIGIIRINGKEDLQPIWISDIIDKVLIGVVTLETLGFEVDTITGTLREKKLMLYVAYPVRNF